MNDNLSSAIDRLRAADAQRPSLPGEHWATVGLGLFLLLRRPRSLLGRIGCLTAGAALIARGLSGRDGALAVAQRAAQERVADENLVEVAAPWPYEERVRVVTTPSPASH